jgi:tetracenomycin A2 monooxygenase-dioxygenase
MPGAAQAYARQINRTAPYLGAKNFEPLADDFNIEIGCLYRSPEVVAAGEDDNVHDDSCQTFGWPGSRAPHVWLERDGKRVSTIDLTGAPFVLVAGGKASAGAAPSASASARLNGVKPEAHCSAKRAGSNAIPPVT